VNVNEPWTFLAGSQTELSGDYFKNTKSTEQVSATILAMEEDDYDDNYDVRDDSGYFYGGEDAVGETRYFERRRRRRW
jgi:hypothetical protein